MDTALADFVRALRAAGAEASTAESIDAARAVALLGYRSRADLKAALGVVLAKSEDDKRLHDEVFERFFAAPAEAAGSTGGEAEVPPRPSSGNADIDALAALADGARPGHSASQSQALQAALQRAAAVAGVDDVQLFTQKSFLVQRMLRALGAGALESRLLELLDDADPAAQADAEALNDIRRTLAGAARALVEQRFALYGAPATENFMREMAVQRPLALAGRSGPDDLERMKAVVTRMARRLAARHARRQRIALRGQLDMRRTLRANAGHDGVPFTLAFKHRRRDKPRIVAVCDVSGSVAAHVRFLLLFLYALHDAVGTLRSFAFASRLEEVSPAFESLPFDDAMALILKTVGLGSTDYGQALSDLHGRHLDAIDRHTTLLVLGDGRSNGTDPRLDLFAELADRAKRVIWLCPEHPGRWGSGDSAMLRYRPLCTSMTHCATAADLERTLDDVLSSYH